MGGMVMSSIGCWVVVAIGRLYCLLRPFNLAWQNMGGMVRSSIECWVVVAIGRLYCSCAISISQRIVKATKAVTWSHPPVLFSIIGTKLSSVRGCSPISCRVVIASFRYSWNAGHSNRVCQTSSSRPLLSWLLHSGLSAS